MAIAIKGEKKFYYVFEIRQEDYENGFQTLTVKGCRKDDKPDEHLTWTEIWKYRGSTHEVFELLRSEENEHGKMIRDNKIYCEYMPKLAVCVHSTFYVELLKRRNSQ